MAGAATEFRVLAKAGMAIEIFHGLAQGGAVDAKFFS
jgi:hypothetical protein